MATESEKKSRAALTQLTQQRELDGSQNPKEMTQALVKQDTQHQRHVISEPGTDIAHDDQAVEPVPELPDPEGASRNNPQSWMDSSLPLILQQLEGCDPQMRIQLVLQERQAAREFAERQAEREAAERKEERERKAAERQAERAFQLELARLKLQGSTPQNHESTDTTKFQPRLEFFPVIEKDGDLNTFLRGFENTCRQYHLPTEQWARYLTPRLKGKALEVFIALPQDKDEDYEAIKEALIHKYSLTPEVYRKRFRTLQRGPNDSYSDVVDGLRTNLQQWIRGLSITTFEELEDLMVKDQFLQICPAEVRQFVMDREPKDATKAAQIADAYTANCKKDIQLLVVTKEYNVKIGPVPKGYKMDFDARAEVCGKLNNVTNMACSPDGFLFCVRNGDLYTGPLPSSKDTDWFSAARRVGRYEWDDFKTIFFHPNGDFYGTTNNGDFYKGPKPDNEDVCWSYDVATKIGNVDWHQYEALFFHPNGDLYAVCKNDTLVKGKPPTAPGHWLASTTRIGRNGWIDLSYFIAISHDEKLWCVDKHDGSIFRGSPPDNDDVNYIGLAENMGHEYHMYRFLCFT